MIRRLRAARLAQGLSLEEVARRTGIAASNLSRLESARVDPRLSTVSRVAAALGLEVGLTPVISMDEVRVRMAEGRTRLAMAGRSERDVAARLVWKEQRGVDTSVERSLE